MCLAEFSSDYFSVFFMKIFSENFPMFPSEKHPAFGHSFSLCRSFGLCPYDVLGRKQHVSEGQFFRQYISGIRKNSRISFWG